jgi:hypothetical protein
MATMDRSTGDSIASLVRVDTRRAFRVSQVALCPHHRFGPIQAGVIPATRLLRKQAMSKAPLKPVEAAGRSVAVRWCILAQQRLDHLHELDTSGRWKLYHTESDFLAMLQEAHDMLKAWQALAPPDAERDRPIEAAIAPGGEETIAGGAAPAEFQPRLLDRIEPQYDFRKA